jgi:hypothetical protein
MSSVGIQEIKIASIPSAMRALDRLEIDIKNAPTLEILNALADAAAGLQRRWKPIKDVTDRAGECWVAADVKRGQELAKVPKAKGARAGEKKQGPRGAYVEPRDTTPTRANQRSRRLCCPELA